ncbi:MAG: hypothetical protein PHP01_07475 [Phycisphaerae bacterium]|nr:hypothetical protein [Phycisphaerae bacterium]
MHKVHFSIVFLIISISCIDILAVNTARIDVVRSKEILVDADTTVIEEFLTEAFDEFLAKTDFSDVASLRTTIVTRSSSEFESGQIQYGPRFFTFTQKQTAQTFEKISQLSDGTRKSLLKTNLLILISDLGNLELSKLAIDYLQSSNITARYWAVCCLTNDSVVRQLNTAGSTENGRIAEEFVKKLQTVVQVEESGDILIQIAQFAANLQQSSANELLSQIIQKRVELYLNWQADNEMVDSFILKSLIDRIQTDQDSTKVMARNFAILYSVAIQKYVLGTETLSADSIHNLVSVIAQGEKYLSRFLADWPGSLKRAIEKGGGAGLLAEHDALLGSASSTGRLPLTVGFDYGRNSDGTVKTAPPKLSNPSKPN